MKQDDYPVNDSFFVPFPEHQVLLPKPSTSMFQCVQAVYAEKVHGTTISDAALDHTVIILYLPGFLKRDDVFRSNRGNFIKRIPGKEGLVTGNQHV